MLEILFPLFGPVFDLINSFFFLQLLNENEGGSRYCNIIKSDKNFEVLEVKLRKINPDESKGKLHQYLFQEMHPPKLKT